MSGTARPLSMVEVIGGGKQGLGYTYADSATAKLIDDKLKRVVVGRDAMSVQGAWLAMLRSIRNLGRPGICSMAISAVDTALWDLKARLLDLPLVRLFGQVRDAVPIYGSGGFTNYSNEQLQEQLCGWAEQGIPRVKMKIGRDAKADQKRVAVAREAIGEDVDLFVDANGAYSRKQALAQAEYSRNSMFAGLRSRFHPMTSKVCVSFESAPLSEWKFPPANTVTTSIIFGECSKPVQSMFYKPMRPVAAASQVFCRRPRFAKRIMFHFRHIARPHCIFMLRCAARTFRHAEYFHDHVRIERMLFDGVPEPVNGALAPDLSRPGLGLILKSVDAQKFAAEAKWDAKEKSGRAKNSLCHDDSRRIN